MKVKELILRNYKGFGADAPPISFVDDLGNVNPVTVLVGPNGSGKSSVLQAIAMLVGSAVRRELQPDALDWPGLGFEWISNRNELATVEVSLSLEPDEILATREYAQQLISNGWNIALPGEDHEIKIWLDLNQNRILAAPHQARSLFQCKGYEYALQLNGGQPTMIANLKRVGAIYWYNEQRTALSITRAVENAESDSQISITDAELRRILHEWDSFHVRVTRPGANLRAGQRDRFATLQALFQSVFPGRSLVGAEPHPSPDRLLSPPLFWLMDEHGNEYELSNLSAGERAIFPMLLDFATWEINNSIILIDEIELHLHPPLQQALVRALSKLGTNNQFIITTHSDYVVGMFGDSQIIRLP